MSTRQFHKTKISVKLPKGVKKGNVASAYSTKDDVIIEGYTGVINIIDSSVATKDMLLCRSKERRVWVKLQT